LDFIKPIEPIEATKNEIIYRDAQKMIETHKARKVSSVAKK
jgi:hypothetical protein